MSVNLKDKPYNLKDEDIAWVHQTIRSMSLEEKIGQLFINMGSSKDEVYLSSVVNTYHIGGVRYNPGPASEVYDQNLILQKHSKIPLLIAANTEAGGNGACSDGTEVGLAVKIAATNDPTYAYKMGWVSGLEASAIGCNWSFAPIVDITYNWRNPIISSRAFSNDPDKVLAMAKAYMKGIMEHGIAPAAKHFPGDGVDERDQHLSFSINSFDVKRWNETFGKVYQGLFDEGLPSIMVGHISLPEYVSHFKPNASLHERILPATLNPWILKNLLRDTMKFNGVVVSDASHMVALTGAMKRQDMLPQAIAAGTDLFLFFNDPDEDFDYMMQGYKQGIISEERLHEALTRILGLKASLGLHKKAKDQFLRPKEEALAKIGLEDNKALFKEVSSKAITLVKDNQNLIPISVKTHPRVLLVDVKGHESGFGKAIAGTGGKAIDTLKSILEEQGFKVSIFESPFAKLEGLPQDEYRKNVMGLYAAKRPITSITDHYDLIINIANVVPGTDQRIQWPAGKGTPDIPFYVHEVPTLFISVQCPFHLADVPQVQTYINAYDNRPVTLQVLVDKLLGKEQFEGVSPVDAFCGLVDTHY